MQIWQATDTNYSFCVHSNYSLQNKLRGNFKRAHTWQISHSAKDLPSHCTARSEAIDKAATKLQPEPGDYSGCWKSAGKNCCSRELESGSTVLNRKLSMLCTPPRKRLLKKWEHYNLHCSLTKIFPSMAGWSGQLSFTMGKTVMRQRKVLVTTGVLPSAGSERCTFCSAVTPM